MGFRNIKEGLRIYRQANPDTWKGQCIGRLYNIYCRIQWRFQKKLIRMNNEIKANHLILGVEYASVAKIEGDIVEFGTMSGETARKIATAMVVFLGKSKSMFKKLYLFDSFVGLPIVESSVDRENPSVMSGAWGQGLLMGLDQKQLITKICKTGLTKDRIKVYAGWFSDTLPQLPDDTKFAMLHIDCDLYKSTVDVLDACFSRGFISEGAIILFDDWNVAMASPSFGERRAWLEMVGEYSVKYSDEGGYGWNGHKFIVHSYRSRLNGGKV